MQLNCFPDIGTPSIPFCLNHKYTAMSCRIPSPSFITFVFLLMPKSCLNSRIFSLFFGDRALTYLSAITLCELLSSSHTILIYSSIVLLCFCLDRELPSTLGILHVYVYVNFDLSLKCAHVWLPDNRGLYSKVALAKLPLTTHPHEWAEPHTLQTQFTLAS